MPGPFDPLRSASRSGRLVAALLATAAVVYVADRATKSWALANLQPGQPQELLGSVLQLHLLFNPGAAFSFGTGLTPFFTVGNALVSIAILVAARKVGSPIWAIAMGLLLGGALGNLTDRLTRPPGFGRGYVVDFLQLPNWPIFNIADSAVVSAAALIALASLIAIPFGGRAHPRHEAAGHPDREVDVRG